MEQQNQLTDLWYNQYFAEGTMGDGSGGCTLCGGGGIIDTRLMAVNERGMSIGRRNWCICPNGQDLRRLSATELPPEPEVLPIDWQLKAEALEKIVDITRRQLKEVCKVWAREECPHRIGDVVTIPRTAAAFRGKPGRVVGRSVARARFAQIDTWAWSLTVTVLKSDGLSNLKGRYGKVTETIEMPMT